ncbi:MAG: serine/threonine protein kinase [Ancrocorticia sp.]|uniref:serine/threonine protein kinase n=1 Tax=Ancrocorticia sp. TaxID=2593684 RepID=UPI003F915FCF
MSERRAEIGGYDIVRKIGSGGMSTVYEAADGQGHRVAMKVLHPHVADTLDGRERMRREVRMLRKVKGPYVAEVLDVETDDDDAFIVTQLIDGPTLEDDVVTGGIYTEEDLASLARNLQKAVASIHAVGVLHRDLKPSNVMMKRGRPVLIDFGIAQLGDDPRITQHGQIAGSPGYTDPQVLRGAEPSKQADWWALAAVLAYAATGYAPFGSDASLVITNRVLRGEMKLPGLTPAIRRAFERALAPDPATRISFEELVRAIEGSEIFDDDGESSPSATAPLSALGGAAAAGAAGVAGAALGKHAQGPGVPADGATEVIGHAADGVEAAGPGQDQTATPDEAGDRAGETEVFGAAGQSPSSSSHGDSHTHVFPSVQDAESGEPGAQYPDSQESVGESARTEIFGGSYGQPPEDSAPTQAFGGAYNQPQQPAPAQPFAGAYNQPAYGGQPAGQNPYAPQAPNGVQPYGGQAYGGQYPPEVPAWLRPPEPAKLIVALIGATLALLAAALPFVAMAIFVVFSITAAVVGAGFHSLNKKRVAKGGRFSGESGWVVRRVPWLVVRGFFSQMLGFLIGGGLGGLTVWLLAMVVSYDQRLGTVAGAAVAMLVSWFMGTNSLGREGARRIVKAVAPSTGYRVLWTVVWVAVVFVAFVVARGSGAPDWYPITTPFFYQSL